jgi:TolB-like protein/AraC-like DNA-binding protein/Tfp pilus assembly protein PilF
MTRKTLFDKSIAVLPFLNISSEEDQEYFCDGITEEIINGLAKIEGLKVTSRTSSFFFKNRIATLKEIAQQLNVGIVLEGSVRISNGTVRITAQLIQAEEDYHFWSDTWDRKMENIFEVQDEISLLIADRLREYLGHLEYGEHLVEKKTNYPDAYNIWLKARYHFNKWNPADVERSVQLFEKALETDPGFTDAWVGLADAYSFMATTQFMPPEEAWKKSIECTQKAWSLNPDNAGVHYLLANISFFTDSSFGDSFNYALKAVQLKPSYPEARQFMAFLYILAGEMEKADYHLQMALATDPLNEETRFYKAYFLYRKGEFEKASAMFLNLLENNPDNIPAFVVNAYCMLFMERYDELISLIEDTSEKTLIHNEKLGILCLAYILKGDRKQSGIYLKRLEHEAADPKAFQAHSYLFMAYASLNKPDDAFTLLGKAMGIKSPILMLSYTDPLTRGLRKDERYIKYHQSLFGYTDQVSPVTGRKPLLDKKTTMDYAGKLLDFVAREKPFLNPTVSIRSLASQLEIHPNQLSWLLNEYMGKKFNEFINHYRLEHFIELVKDPDNARISVIGLAYESGFNSKTVFNTFFKKEMGMTPLEYLKSLDNLK